MRNLNLSTIVNRTIHGLEAYLGNDITYIRVISKFMQKSVAISSRAYILCFCENSQ